MASLPLQSPPSSSQRLSPQSHIAPPTPDRVDASSANRMSSSKSTASDGSQIVLLDKSSPSGAASEASQAEQTTTSAISTLPSDNYPRKCWICFADETEDIPTSSAWRSPCPCALTAHESCLLDWVADLEAPSSRKRTGSSPKIQCPQCKSNITIARPRSFVVEGVQAVDRIAGRMILPGVAVTLAGGLFSLCWINGLTSVYLIFGQEDFVHLMGFDTGKGISAKMGFGLPLIPFVLVLSRTTTADNVLPILPFLFFATQVPEGGYAQMDLWPPSAAMSFATLPYIRGIYNAAYRALFAAKEEQWIKEVQPRSGDNENGDAPPGDNAGEGDGNLDFGFNLEVEIIQEDGVLEPPAAVEQADGHAAAEGIQAAAPPEPAQVPGARRPAPAPAQPVPARQGNILMSTSRLADSIIGALCFPAIASAMGALLKVGLPKSWTSASFDRRPGLLQTKWGRSIVGGCLFVVTKDMLLLYSRYRIAQDHRKRRVVDYDRSKGTSRRK